MLTFLFVNNVSTLLGGTLGCTLSMTKALPDAKHIIFSFGSPFDDVTKSTFGDNCTLLNGTHLRSLVEDYDVDVVIYQNTHPSKIPNLHPSKVCSVYYHHSDHDPSKVKDRCDHFFTVSHYLADKWKLDKSHVLWQPVTVPPKRYERPKIDRLQIGRICSPQSKKWELDKIIEWIEPINKAVDADFHFVGCPEPMIKQIRLVSDKFSKPLLDFYYLPSFEARSYLHSWDILLYNSSCVESFGRTIREAQRCGCYPIVPRSGGFIEQIEHGGGAFATTGDDAVNAIRFYQNGFAQQWREEITKHGDRDGSLIRWREKFLTIIQKG